MVRAKAHAARRDGVAAVELALLLPLIIVLLLGIWEVGRLIDVNQILTNAAREGARQASTGQNNNASVQQGVVNYLNHAGIPTANVAITVNDLTTPNTDASNATQLDQLQITVTIPFNDVRWIALNLITSSTTQLTGSAIWSSLKDRTYPNSVTSPPAF
jgi:Flp pilus assembly protein TadG